MFLVPSSYCSVASLATIRWSLPPQLVTARWRSLTLWGPLSLLVRKTQLSGYPFELGHALVVCHISFGQFFITTLFLFIFLLPDLSSDFISLGVLLSIVCFFFSFYCASLWKEYLLCTDFLKFHTIEKKYWAEYLSDNETRV